MLTREAAVAGLELGGLLAGEEGRAEVLSEDAAARRAGLNGVPSFALDGHLVFSGALPAEQNGGCVPAGAGDPGEPGSLRPPALPA